MKALLTTLGLAVWAAIAAVLFTAMVIIGYRAAFPGATPGARESQPALPAVAGAPAGADSIATLPQLPSGVRQDDVPTRAAEAPRGHDGMVVDPAAHMPCLSQDARDCGPAVTAASGAQASRPEYGYGDVGATYAMSREQLGERIRQLLPDLDQASDRFMAYRLLYMTGWMRPGEFQVLAQRLDDAGLGLEAMRMRSRASGQAAPVESAAALGAVESAAIDGDAESLAKLGEWYVAAGRMGDAVVVLEKALRLGLRMPAEASVYLCLAEERLGNLDAARRMAAGVAAEPGQDPRLAELWRLYRPL